MGFGNAIEKLAVLMLTGSERRNTSGASWHFGDVNRAKEAHERLFLASSVYRLIAYAKKSGWWHEAPSQIESVVLP